MVRYGIYCVQSAETSGLTKAGGFARRVGGRMATHDSSHDIGAMRSLADAPGYMCADLDNNGGPGY